MKNNFKKITAALAAVFCTLPAATSLNANAAAQRYNLINTFYILNDANSNLKSFDAVFSSAIEMGTVGYRSGDFAQSLKNYNYDDVTKFSFKSSNGKYNRTGALAVFYGFTSSNKAANQLIDAYARNLEYASGAKNPNPIDIVSVICGDVTSAYNNANIAQDLDGINKYDAEKATELLGTYQNSTCDIYYDNQKTTVSAIDIKLLLRSYSSLDKKDVYAIIASDVNNDSYVTMSDVKAINAYAERTIPDFRYVKEARNESELNSCLAQMSDTNEFKRLLKRQYSNEYLRSFYGSKFV